MYKISHRKGVSKCVGSTVHPHSRNILYVFPNLFRTTLHQLKRSSNLGKFNLIFTVIFVDRIDQKFYFYFIILNHVPTIVFNTIWLAIERLRLFIGQGNPTDQKEMKSHKIGHRALIINALISKSSSVVISPFSISLSPGE